MRRERSLRSALPKFLLVVFAATALGGTARADNDRGHAKR